MGPPNEPSIVDPLAPIRDLIDRAAALESQLAAANEEIRRLRQENSALRHAVLVLTARVEELERMLGQGGRGGGRGTPPPNRPPSGKPRGGQPGHKGHSRERPTHIDETKEHPVGECCPRCGGPVAASDKTDEHFEL